MAVHAPRYTRFLVPFLILGAVDGSYNAFATLHANHYLADGMHHVAAQVAAARWNSAMVFALAVSSLLYLLAFRSPLARGDSRLGRAGTTLLLSTGVVVLAGRILNGHDWSAKMVSIGIWRGWHSESFVLEWPLPLAVWRWIDAAYHAPLASAAKLALLLAAGATAVAIVGRLGRTDRDPAPSRPLSRRGPPVVIAFLLACTLVLNGAARAVPARTASRPHDVIWITWDSTRADHLSCYGYQKPTTPALAGLCRDAVVFDAAFAQHNWTRPSYASMFTGRYDWELAGPGLAPASTTLTEILKDHGYATVAFTQNPNLDAEFGFDQGFDTYVQLPGRSTAGLVNEFALPALRRLVADAKPFFLFVHYQEPHWPYRLDSGWVETFAGREAVVSEQEIQALMWQHGQGWDGSAADAARRLSYIRSLYDADLRATDQALAALLEVLRSHDRLWQRSLIVFNSDHGDEFGERGGFGHGHGNLHAELTRVPFVIRFPASMEIGPRRSPAAVAALDVYPTVLGVTGIAGDRKQRGRSLVGVARGEQGRRRVASFHGELLGLRDRRRTVLLDGGSGRVESFDRTGDPGELRPLEPSQARASHEGLLREARELSARTAERLAREHTGGRAGVRDDLARRLKALGYLQ